MAADRSAMTAPRSRPARRSRSTPPPARPSSATRTATSSGRCSPSVSRLGDAAGADSDAMGAQGGADQLGMFVCDISSDETRCVIELWAFDPF